MPKTPEVSQREPAPKNPRAIRGLRSRALRVAVASAVLLAPACSDDDDPSDSVATVATASPNSTSTTEVSESAPTTTDRVVTTTTTPRSTSTTSSTSTSTTSTTTTTDAPLHVDTWSPDAEIPGTTTLPEALPNAESLVDGDKIGDIVIAQGGNAIISTPIIFSSNPETVNENLSRGAVLEQYPGEETPYLNETGDAIIVGQIGSSLADLDRVTIMDSIVITTETGRLYYGLSDDPPQEFIKLTDELGTPLPGALDRVRAQDGDPDAKRITLVACYTKETGVQECVVLTAEQYADEVFPVQE